MENLELILKNMFEEHPLTSADNFRSKDKTDSMKNEQMEKNNNEEQADISRQGCQSSVLDSIKSKVRLEMQMVVRCLFHGITLDMTRFFV